MTSGSVHLGSGEGMLSAIDMFRIVILLPCNRICPGQHVANRSIFVNAALILSVFRLSEDPETPIDSFDFSDTVNQIAAPFRVNFEPRSSEAQIRQLCTANDDDYTL